MTVNPPTAALGQTVQASATGLSPHGVYDLEVCGQNAVNGTSDCAVAGTVSAVAGADGTLSMPVEVVAAPTPCPCVVAAFSISSNASPLTAPLSIEGASTSTAPAPPAQTPRPNVVVVSAKMGTEPLGAWFGLPVTETMALTLKNNGTEAARSIAIFATIGSTPVLTRRLAGLAIGQQRTYMVPVNVPALTMGQVTVMAHLDRGNGQLDNFKVPSPLWPWGLFIVLFFIVQLILYKERQVRRRRREQKQPPTPTKEAPEETSTFAGESVGHRS
jgi:hypothetical protein